jgi:hypothetical protein
MTVNLNGEKSDNHFALTSFQVADKLVFAGMFGRDQSEAGVKLVRKRLLDWKDKLSSSNPSPMLVRKAAAEDPAKET